MFPWRRVRGQRTVCTDIPVTAYYVYLAVTHWVNQPFITDKIHEITSLKEDLINLAFQSLLFGFRQVGSMAKVNSVVGIPCQSKAPHMLGLGARVGVDR